MHSMQRQFGKLWNKGPGDNAKVSVLLNDYEDADKVLAKLVDNAKTLRESWLSLVTSQLQVVTEYEGLYDPIVGASDGARDVAPTPQLQLERTFKLKEAYSELQTELTEEIALIEGHVMQPAADARDAIAPIRKTIKKRENKRLDYEKAQEKALKLQRKPGRTVKEDAALAKAETERTRAADEFSVADEHLRQTLPPIIAASFSLIEPLLANLVLIQNRLLGLYYTILHGYCEEFGFPSPPPPMEDVIATWNSAFGPVRSQVESISFLARGKAVHQPMNAGAGTGIAAAPPLPRPGSVTSTTGPGRRTSSGLISGPSARTLRVPSSTSLRAPSPAEDPPTSSSSSLYRPDYANATDFTTATMLGGGTVTSTTASARSRGPSPSPSPSVGTSGGAQRDYFSSTRQAGAASSPAVSPYAVALAGKKKPPPPPVPPKRPAASKQPDEWVVAQYAFSGEGGGDLSFRQGDRIRVVKRTGTDQDWWVGELAGVTGNFPANYCKAP